MGSLPRVIYVLGAVSLCTEVSAEMVNPLLPGFLAATLGAAPWAIGLIEGAAGTTAALLKVVAGAWSDRLGRRVPFLVAGYTLAGVARPLMALATAWPHVLVLRLLDRVGKGLRTAPRDALIADVTLPAQRGRAFGVHRALDHAGAVYLLSA